MARMIFVVSAAVATLLVGSAVGAPDLQEPHRACLEASSGGHTWYYAINTDVSGTTLDRWKLNGAATYVDRNTYAAFHLPEGGRPTWDEGVAFAATMQTRNAWLNNEPTNTATWEYDADAGEDTMTWKTTVNAVEQDFVFRTNQCRDLTAPHTPIPEPPATTDVPTQPQEPDTPPPNGILHACLEASSRGVTYFYEIYSDKANDAAGTSFDRYTVAGGVDTFVDSNDFAALRAPDGDLPWHQGIQFADAMQSRAVWMNTEPTSAAEYEYDGASGEYTLTFYTTVNGGPQDYIFRTSQCRGGDVPSEPQEPDTTKAPCRKCHPTTDVPTEPQEPDTEAPCTDEPTTDVPTEPQEPDTEEPCTDEPTTEEPCTDEPATDVPTEPQEPDTEEPCTDEPTTEEPCTDEPATDVPTEPQEPDTEEPCPPKHYKSK